ncbi:hypothetical protein BDZ45DRAFT_754246 [Acephala macrosclerotiorum]|nr:hypothetical protein BDZ45DRAFT_754246 [Acephala macrosclerotiorum]
MDGPVVSKNDFDSIFRSYAYVQEVDIMYIYPTNPLGDASASHLRMCYDYVVKATFNLDGSKRSCYSSLTAAGLEVDVLAWFDTISSQALAEKGSIDIIIVPIKRTKSGSPDNYILKVLMIEAGEERGQYRRVGYLRWEVSNHGHDLEMDKSYLKNLVCHVDELQCIDTRVDEDGEKFIIDLT